MSNWKELTASSAAQVKQNDEKVKLLKIKIKDLQSRILDLDTMTGDLREFIIATLEDNGVDKLAYDGVTVTMSDSPYSVVIADDAEVPQDYKKIVETISIDKKALINNRDSLNIDGVEFVQTKKLTIKVQP